MKKILYIITSLRRTGPVNILFDLIKGLDRASYDVHVLTLCPEEGDSRWREFEAASVKVTSLDLPRGLSFFLNAVRIRNEVKNIQPDLVHTIGFRGDFLAAIFLRRHYKISSQLNYPFDDYVMTFGKVVGGAMANSTVWALKNFDYAVACSTDVAQRLTSSGLTAKVVFNGIDDTRFVPVSPEERAAQRARLGLWDDAEPVFIFVGVMSDRKQPLVAINAFLRLQRQIPNAALIVLGDGPLLKECQEVAKEARVCFAGNVPDTRPYLAASDIYIATSKAEGMPVSVIEALAMRLPVILSDINPHREILGIDEGAGVLVQMGSEDSTFAAMRKIAGENRTAMGHHARRIVDIELSSSIMSKKFQTLYESLV